MNTESVTPPPFRAQNVREEMCYKVGKLHSYGIYVGERGIKAGLLPPKQMRSYLLTSGFGLWPRGEAFLSYDLSERADESGHEHYEN